MRKRLLVIAVILSLTLVARAWVSRTPPLPQREQLAQFPITVQGWSRMFDDTLTPEVQQVLRADDYLSRRYTDSQGHVVDFFIAYYKTQNAGETMHSPKNCLPGAGWRPILNDTVQVQVGNKGRVDINRYVIEKGTSRALVLYWYQANGRVIANEYWGKVYLVLDALRTGRRDGGIVRVFIPLRQGDDLNSVTPMAVAFAESTSGELPRFLPD
jgi:EpsI family protein